MNKIIINQNKKYLKYSLESYIGFLILTFLI